MASDASPAAHPEAGSGQQPWRLLILLCIAMFMVALDVTIVNIALPSIAQDLYFGPGDLQWPVSIYVLATGALLMIGGRVTDLVGARTTFFLGLGLFILTSITSGLSTSSAVLIGSRAGQGIGAALLAPAALSIITNTYRGAQRAAALGAWGAIASGGAAAGLLVGGALTTWFDWRWVFFINVPVGIAAFVVGMALIPRQSRVPSVGREFDIAGAVVGTAALSLVVYAITGSVQHGWGSARTLLLLISGLVLLLIFGLVEKRVQRPLVPPALWSERSLAASTAGMFGATILLTGSLFLSTFLLQRELETSALMTGLALLPMAVAIAFAAHLAEPILAHVGSRVASTTGMVLAGLGALLLGHVESDPSYALNLLPGFLLLGFGLGLAFTSLTVTSMSDIDADRSGSASGLFMTAHDLGGAFGTALLASVATVGGVLGVLSGEQRAFLVAAAIAGGFALLLAVAMPTYRPPARAGGPRQSAHGMVIGHG